MTQSSSKLLSPMKAIRAQCLECGNGQFKEVRLCPVIDCELYPYRFGHGPEQKAELTSLKSIRAKCIDCSTGNMAEVKRCWNTECVLYEYRMGKNPNLTGKRQINIEGLRKYREIQSMNSSQDTRRDSEAI